MTKERKRQNFERIATRRVNEIIDKIESLKALSNTSYYEYTDNDIRKIIEALNEALKSLDKYYFNEHKRRFHL